MYVYVDNRFFSCTVHQNQVYVLEQLKLHNLGNRKYGLCALFFY
jgi:hypothetical protein